MDDLSGHFKKAWNVVGDSLSSGSDHLQSGAKKAWENVMDSTSMPSQRDSAKKSDSHSLRSVNVASATAPTNTIAGDSDRTSRTKAAQRKMNVSTAVNVSMGGGAEMWLKELEPERSGCSFVSSATSNTDQQLQKLSLRLLRGKNLPAEESAYFNIYLNNFLLISTIKMEEGSPTWGGPLYTFQLEADPTRDTLLFEWSAYGLAGKVHVPVSRLLVQDKLGKVNHWVKIAAGGTGQIQLRVTPTPEEAHMHHQETCRKLTAGPAVPEHMKASYVMRKQILYGKGSPVMLHVYDVSNSPTIANANEYLKSMGYGGIYHAGIEIHGREYSFGGTHHKNYQGTGIFTNPPKQCSLHHYHESVYLGDCELDKKQVALLLMQMESDWKAKSYNVLRHNCCFFSQALAVELGVGNLPEWVYSLSENVQDTSMEPALMALLADQEKANQKQQADEAMLDHAMAQKIQKSWRQKSTNKLPVKASDFKTPDDYDDLPKKPKAKPSRTKSPTRKPRPHRENSPRHGASTNAPQCRSPTRQELILNALAEDLKEPN